MLCIALVICDLWMLCNVNYETRALISEGLKVTSHHDRFGASANSTALCIGVSTWILLLLRLTQKTPLYLNSMLPAKYKNNLQTNTYIPKWARCNCNMGNMQQRVNMQKIELGTAAISGCGVPNPNRFTTKVANKWMYYNDNYIPSTLRWYELSLNPEDNHYVRHFLQF